MSSPQPPYLSHNPDHPARNGDEANTKDGNPVECVTHASLLRSARSWRKRMVAWSAVQVPSGCAVQVMSLSFVQRGHGAGDVGYDVSTDSLARMIYAVTLLPDQQQPHDQ
jgi:hypothetical protein